MNLDTLLQHIADFERAAFEDRYPNVTARKKAMRFAKDSCPDDTIREILGRDINRLALQPAFVRRAIALARAHVETLRYHRRHE